MASQAGLYHVHLPLTFLSMKSQGGLPIPEKNWFKTWGHDLWGLSIIICILEKSYRTRTTYQWDALHRFCSSQTSQNISNELSYLNPISRKRVQEAFLVPDKKKPSEWFFRWPELFILHSRLPSNLRAWHILGQVQDSPLKLQDFLRDHRTNMTHDLYKIWFE